MYGILAYKGGQSCLHKNLFVLPHQTICCSDIITFCKVHSLKIRWHSCLWQVGMFRAIGKSSVRLLGTIGQIYSDHMLTFEHLHHS